MFVLARMGGAHAPKKKRRHIAADQGIVTVHQIFAPS